MALDISSKLEEIDYHIVPALDISIPEEIIPDLITNEGVLIFTISSNPIDQDSLYTAVGKTTTLKKYLEEKNLIHRYSVILGLTHEQFRKLDPELRIVLNDQVSILII